MLEVNGIEILTTKNLYVFIDNRRGFAARYHTLLTQNDTGTGYLVRL